MKEQRAKLERAEKENKRLAAEEEQRRANAARKKARAEAQGKGKEQIDRLKKELEKVNEQLDSALSMEKAR